MLSQDEAHRMAYSRWTRDRYQSLDSFQFWSKDFTDKEQIWEDILFLTKDKNSNIRQRTRYILGKAFNEIVDKEKGWQDIHKLSEQEDPEARCTAANTIGNVFEQIPDKERAWEDLHRLVNDKNFSVQIYAISAVSSAFEHIPDKEQAWENLHGFINNENDRPRSIWILQLFHDLVKPSLNDRLRAFATLQLGSVFAETSFKERAWEDLHRMANDKAPIVRGFAAQSLAFSFSNIPDRDLAWHDFHQLINDKNKNVKNYALIFIEIIFSQITNKEMVWKDLHILANDRDINTRSFAVCSLISFFINLADKKSAWQDIHQAIIENKIKIDHKYKIADKLGEIIEQIPNKNQLIQDLCKLTKGKKNRYVKDAAANSISKLGRYYVLNKDFERAYECFDTASALSGGFLKPSDLQFDSNKAFSFYYRGRFLVSKLPDIKDPEEYKKNIKNAVNYFEKAIKYGQKYFTFRYEEEACCFPICLNIYSALYEYNLSLLELDEKRVTKIKMYLDEASEQCTVVGKEKGIKIIRILEKLSEALRDRIEEVKLESKKQEAGEKGKGYNARYITFIEKSRKDAENHFAEIDDLLNQLEAPIFKKIAAIEKENLKNLRAKEGEKELLPKSFGKSFIEHIKSIWKFIVAVIVFLASVATIMNWGVVSEFFKNLFGR